MSLNGQLANTLAVVSTFEEKSEAQTTIVLNSNEKVDFSYLMRKPSTKTTHWAWQHFSHYDQKHKDKVNLVSCNISHADVNYGLKKIPIRCNNIYK